MASRFFTWNPFSKNKEKFHAIEIDRREIAKIRELCPQFHILIIGRANSGKTTIIQKMCDTDEDPIVHDQNGNEVPASVLQDPDAMRGIHDIRLRITFKSNPNFLFHDSMGFEAGSPDEVQKVKDFIQECLAKTELRDRLHMIWYCVPTDSDRVASKAELSFFQQSTGGIPVIVLFTKWDGQIINACNILRRREHMERRQAVQEAPARAQKILEEQYIPVFMNTPFPPVSYTVLGYMDKPETKCEELSEKTAAALDNNVLKKLFVSVQTHNLELCIKGAINEVICDYYWSLQDNTTIRLVISWFPHIYFYHDYSGQERRLLEYVSGRSSVRLSFQSSPSFAGLSDNSEKNENEWVADPSSVFLSSPDLPPPAFPITDSENLAPISPSLFQFRTSRAAIVAAHSFEVNKRTGSTPEAVQASIEEYLASSQYVTVRAAITSKFHLYAKTSLLHLRDLSRDARRRISEDLQQICLDNLLG